MAGVAPAAGGHGGGTGLPVLPQQRNPELTADGG